MNRQNLKHWTIVITFFALFILSTSGCAPESSPAAFTPTSGAGSFETVLPITTTTTTMLAPQNSEQPSKSHPKLASSLNQLLEAYQRGGLAEAQAFAKTHMMVLEDDRVQVVIVTTPEASSDLKEAVEALGGEYQGHRENLSQAFVPIDGLEELAEQPDVQLIREPRRPELNTTEASP